MTSTIIQILQDASVDFATSGEHHHARPNWLAIRTCPFCNSQNYHLGYNLTRGFFSCWKCRGHRIIPTLIRLGVPWKVAEDFAKGRELLPAEQERERIRLVEPKGRGPLLRIHREYLRGRGFDPAKLAQLWELEGIGRAGGKLAWTIYIPIIRKDKRVSWTSRAVNDNGSRYMSASPEQESVNHKKILYGADYVVNSAVVVEGPTDVWNIGPGAVGTLGTGYTDAHVLALSRIPYRFICFDSSTTAQQRAEDLAAELAPFPGETVNVELDAEDPGSASRKEVGKLRRMARLD